ncbi:MAG: cysteine hydrolase [Candidatus Sungbacteria bacterium]|nr:cysteine hydrolase [Candidatus Sungbacteria bacterium]
MRALLVVDVDLANDWHHKFFVIKEKRRVARALKEALAQTRSQGIPVAFVIFADDRKFSGQEAQIKIEEERKPCIGCSRAETRLAPFLRHRHHPFEPMFMKTKWDAFSNQMLLRHFLSLGVREIMLAGCFTSSCVKETATGAVKNGFSVTLLRRCVYRPFADKHQEENWLEEVKRSIPHDSANAVSVRIWGTVKKPLAKRLRDLFQGMRP